MRDHYNNLKIDQCLDPDTVTTDTDCDSVDLLGYNDGVLFIVNVGASGDTLSSSLYTELEVEESADDSSFTDVDDSDLSNYVAGNNDGTFAKIDAAAEDDAVFYVQYKGSKLYARVVINVTGTHSNGTPIAVTAIRLGKQSLPVS